MLVSWAFILLTDQLPHLKVVIFIASNYNCKWNLWLLFLLDDKENDLPNEKLETESEEL